MRIESPLKEYQVQSEVLRQQQEGQQVIAEVLKMMMAGRRQEQQRHQGTTGTSLIGTEVDDSSGTDPNFPNAPSPNSGPPNNGGFSVPMNVVPQIPTSMAIVRLFRVKEVRKKMQNQTNKT